MCDSRYFLYHIENYIPVKEKFFKFQWLARECLCMRLVFLASALGIIPYYEYVHRAGLFRRKAVQVH